MTLTQKIITTFLICLLCVPALTVSQEVDDLARSVVDLKQRLEKDLTLAEAMKADLAVQIQTADANLAKVDDLQQRTIDDQAATLSASSRSAAFAEETKKLLSSPPPAVNASMLLADIEGEVTTLTKTVDQLKKDLEKNSQEMTRRSIRRPELRSLLDSVEKQLGEIKTSLAGLTTVENTLSNQVVRTRLLTSQRLAEAEIASLNAEQERYEAGEREKVITKQRELLSLQLSQSQTRLAELEKLQADKRQQAARQAADAAANAQSAIELKNPLLLSSYEFNTVLAKRVLEIEARLAKDKKKYDEIKKETETLVSQFRETEKRVKKLGLSDSVGAMLRKRKSALPSITASSANADKIKLEFNEVQSELFDVEQLLDELSPASIKSEIELAYGFQELDEKLDKPIADLIVARREKLSSVKESLGRLVDQLFDLESKERELAIEAGKYREYINERILWIRSNDVLFSTIEIDRTDWVVFKLSSWIDAFKRVWQVIYQSPAFFGFASFVIMLLLILKPKLRIEVDRLGQVASRGSCDTYWPTARAFVLTVLVAITVPSIPLALGWGLSQETFIDSPLFNGLGPALMAVAWFSIPFEILRRMCRPAGIANEHFDWSDDAVTKLRRNLGQFVIPGAVLVFFIAVLRNLDQTHRVDLIERVLFVIAMAGFALFSWKTFSPKHGIFDEYLKANESSWANQVSGVWFTLILLVPVSMAVLAVWGFYYTAINLAEYAFATFVFAVIVETMRELIKRVILVRRRHVLIQASRRKRDAQMLARKEMQKAQAEAQAAGLPPVSSAAQDNLAASTLDPPTLGSDSSFDLQHELDIDENAKQANKLVSLGMVLVWVIGMWVIWADALPALRELDNYPLWPIKVVEGDTPAAKTAMPTPTVPVAPSSTTGGSPSTTGATTSVGTTSASSTIPTAEEITAEYVTVRNLLMFFLIVIVTIISTRNLPSALEMLLLEHLPVDRSFRYAIKSLVSYAIVMVGMVLAFRSLSIAWSSVQWLATALTFGLAFGLQEIFANFVAGIILMFERPMRIGDWITVDEFTGVVTKIRTRATTIVNWDRKEYVIPNKDFITGRLVNWTLSDTLNRIVINVGVAYGSDVELTKKLLHEICQNHPKTVDDPPTRVAFELFGENSLNFSIRTFITEIDSRLLVIDDLHTQIDAAFRKAGIVIAFPQRDLHISSIGQDASDSIRGTKQIVDVKDE